MFIYAREKEFFSMPNITVGNLSDAELRRKWDWCMADAIPKTGPGFGLGLVFSLTFLKRRMWPLH